MIRTDGDNHDTVTTVDGEAPPANGEVYVAEPVEEREGPTRLQQVGGVVAQLLVAGLIVGLGGLLAWWLVSTKSAPAKIPGGRAAPVVVVSEVVSGATDPTIRGYGRVRAADELRVVPQVGGRVIEAHPGLRLGGRIPAGEVVLRIDPADYEVALDQAQADLERARAARTRVDARRRAAEAEVARRETGLETIRAEAEVSRSEFERINPNRPVPPLVAREPQVRENEAALASAEAALQDTEAEALELDAQIRQAESRVRGAELSLERTALTLPGEAGETYRVAEESVDVGQTVVAGQSVATLYDAGSLEVPVPLEDRRLRFVRVPGSEATVVVGEGVELPGVVDRTEAQIDARSQLTEVVVAIEPESGDVLPTPGRFVEVLIDGETIEDVAAIPRPALRTDRDGSPYVYLAVDGDVGPVLARRTVEVARRDGDVLYVRGLDSGDRVVLTRLDAATEGMAVQVGEVQTDDGLE